MNEQQTYEIFRQPDELRGYQVNDIVFALRGLSHLMYEFTTSGGDLGVEMEAGLSCAFRVLSEELCSSMCTRSSDEDEKIAGFIQGLSAARSAS